MKNKTAKKNIIINHNLFENVCTCGNEYDKCNIDLKDCKEFKMHKQSVTLRKRHLERAAAKRSKLL